MAPAVGFASSAWFFLLLIGIFANIAGLAQLAIVLFALVVLFQLVTLPVEFDASRRAKQQLSALGLVTAGESEGAGQVLSAAALTYVAAALVALTQLLYLVIPATSRPPAVRPLALVLRAGAVVVAVGFVLLAARRRGAVSRLRRVRRRPRRQRRRRRPSS